MAKRSRFMNTLEREVTTPDVDREPILPEEVTEEIAVEVVPTPPPTPAPALEKTAPAVVRWEVFGEQGSKSFESVGDTLREVKHQLQAGCLSVRIERR
jgi:hypothetical protein